MIAEDTMKDNLEILLISLLVLTPLTIIAMRDANAAAMLLRVAHDLLIGLSIVAVIVYIASVITRRRAGQ
jgi:hypothetical protein